MVVCKFWQQGNCRFGERCKFDHPTASASRPVPNGNRYAALQSHDNSRNSNGYQGESSSHSQSSQASSRYLLDKATIITDLSSERPQWILSAYGPGRYAPAQLFGGPLREQSFEEMRFAHYLGAASGNPQQAVAKAEKIFQASEQQMQNALNDIDGAINFITRAENDHPNRIDIVRESLAGGLQPASQQNPFSNSSQYQTAPISPNPPSAPSQPTSALNPFGAPSQPSHSSNQLGVPFQAASTSNPFRAPSQPAAVPAFGAPSLPGAFSQPSSLGQIPNPFRAPSALTFGAPTQLGGAFGQPSALGQKPNPFRAPAVGAGSSQPGTSLTFSNATTLFGGQPNPVTSNLFGAPSQPAFPTPLGQLSQPQPNPFGPGQAATSSGPKPISAAVSFGGAAPLPFGATSLAPRNSFGAQSQSSLPAKLNPFVQPPQSTNQNPLSGNPALQPNPFVTQVSAPPSNPFGRPSSNTPSNPNPFGDPASGDRSSAPNPFSQPASSLKVNGISNRGSNIPIPAGHPALNTYSSKDDSGRLTMFKGRRVQYRDSHPGVWNSDGSWEKIWFPEGAPPYNKDTEFEDSAYDEGTKQAYLTVRQTGSFPGGLMPLLPPMREWCLWDF